MPEYPEIKLITDTRTPITNALPCGFTLARTIEFNCATDETSKLPDIKGYLEEHFEIVSHKIVNCCHEIADAVRGKTPISVIHYYIGCIDELLKPIPQHLRTAPETQGIEEIFRVEMIAILLNMLKCCNVVHKDAKLKLIN